MECLIFAPRAYYFEIETTDAALTILQKNPAEGTITAKKKVYELGHKKKLLELINDLSAAFLDEMINLRLIAHITASALRERKYKDFLSPPPGRGKKLQLHCWHVFVPDCHHARGEIPDEYNAEVDSKLVVPPKYQCNQIPDCTQDQLDNSVIEVDQFNIKDNTDFFEDVSFCCGHRNPLGTPINMKGQKYSDVWKEKAKYLKHQMVMEDVKKLLEMVAHHFHDHIVRKKITESLPEINPARENEENVWVMTNDTKGVYMKLLESENVVISPTFPDPVDPEDEDAHLDPPPPPQPEEEEVIGKLKFTSYTSNKIRQYYTEYIEKKNARQAEHPGEQYIFPHSEWTPGKPSKFARQLMKMLEGGDSGDPLSKKLTYDEPIPGQSLHQEAPEEERQQRREHEEAEKTKREKLEREHEQAERAREEEREREREERQKQEREREEAERVERKRKEERERKEAERVEREKEEEREREKAEREEREREEKREREEAEKTKREKLEREREEAERAEREREEERERKREERQKQEREHEEAEKAASTATSTATAGLITTTAGASSTSTTTAPSTTTSTVTAGSINRTAGASSTMTTTSTTTAPSTTTSTTTAPSTTTSARHAQAQQHPQPPPAPQQQVQAPALQQVQRPPAPQQQVQAPALQQVQRPPAPQQQVQAPALQHAQRPPAPQQQVQAPALQYAQ